MKYKFLLAIPLFPLLSFGQNNPNNIQLYLTEVQQNAPEAQLMQSLVSLRNAKMDNALINDVKKEKSILDFNLNTNYNLLKQTNVISTITIIENQELDKILPKSTLIKDSKNPFIENIHKNN